MVEGVWSPSLIGWIDYESINLEHGKICLESNNQGQTHKRKKKKEGIPLKNRRRQRINNVMRTIKKKKKKEKGPNYGQRPTEFADFSKGL